MSEAEPAKTDPYRFRLGSYGVLNSLGSGGMSSVYRAVHLDLGREVALKVLPPHMAKNPTVLRRFVGEAKNAETLEHPNIVSIYDRGSDQGRYYLVLEFVGGGDFHDHVQRHGPMRPTEAVEVIRQVAQGLEYAASRGVIHRDIKPSNLLRTPDGRAKIADLGLALRAEDEDQRVTREGTTVGTVDYMAPEQARDSRATSLLSDIYSLGCTFHYLLTGSPPFPGGSIAERLGRHAQEPAPDVRARRPEIPPAVAAIATRMMAKRPEDRFATYRDLLAALNTVDAAATATAANHDTTIALAPIDDEPPPALPAPRPSGQGVAAIDGPSRPASSPPEISLASLVPALLEADKPISRREVPIVAPRRTTISIGPRGSTLSDRAWLIRCVFLGFLTIVVVIGLDLIIRPYPNFSPAETDDEAEPIPPRQWTQPKTPEPTPRVEPVAPVVDAEPSVEVKPPPTPTPPAWVEPEDPALVVGPPKSYPTEILAEYLPDWGREPIPDEIDGPTTVVQRVVEKREPGSVASLRLAFDVPKGTIEINDAGPHFIDDARVSGETRLVRAGGDARPVIRIEGTSSDAVRALPGIFALDGRTLILDSLDLVVNVKDLGMNQRTLFQCAGSRVTLRNCTVTIVNPLRLPFVFFRADDPDGRESRLRIEDTLIRGDAATLIELGRGPTELLIVRSALFVDGPIIRLVDGSPSARHALYAMGSAMGARGPCFDLGSAKAAGAEPRLAAKVFDCAFGRFAGSGVSSWATSGDPNADLARLLQWRGSENLFSGWGSYFANGPETTIQVRNLQGFHSTWNNGSNEAREIPAEWPAPPAIADAAPELLRPFAPGFEWLIARVARPRPYLLARTVLNFPVPRLPQVAAQAGEGGSASGGNGVVELVFDADSDQWNGDLGAFLRDEAKVDRRHLRVRVVGSGLRRCSPAKLPDGLVLEMIVEQPSEAGAPRLSFSPTPEARGKALLELRGGALILSRFRFQVEGGSVPESLVKVDDGHLVLQHCELLGPPNAGGGRGPAPARSRLVDFRAASTKPRTPPPGPPVFVGTVDRPVCLISESVLATGGSAIRAEVGAGLVAIQESLVAARGDAIVLAPAKVARSRFTADLRIDRCTMVSSASIIRLGAWPGDEPGPDRPWLITSSNTALLDFPDRDRPARESVLFRADEASFARGEVFWRQSNDAVEVFGFAVAGSGPPVNKTRDIVSQWINLWGGDNIRGVSGPRPGASAPSIRFRGATRPGRIELAELVLDTSYHPGRPWLDLGADPARLGVSPRAPRPPKR